MEDVYRKADRTSFVLYCLWIYILPLLYFLQYYPLPGLFVCLSLDLLILPLPLQRWWFGGCISSLNWIF